MIRRPSRSTRTDTLFPYTTLFRSAVEPCLHIKKAFEADDLARFVKADQIAHPAKQRNVGDAVVSPHHPVAPREPLVEDTEQPRRLGCIAVARTLVLIGLTGEFVEEAQLTEHRPHSAHLTHHPLDRFVAVFRIGGDDLSNLLDLKAKRLNFSN